MSMLEKMESGDSPVKDLRRSNCTWYFHRDVGESLKTGNENRFDCKMILARELFCGIFKSTTDYFRRGKN